MYVALGLGVLTKGPVALVVPALVCVVWLAGRAQAPGDSPVDADARSGDRSDHRAAVVRRRLRAAWLVLHSGLSCLRRTSAIRHHGDDPRRPRRLVLPAGPARGPVSVGTVGPGAADRRRSCLALGRGPEPDETADRALDRLLWIWIVLFVAVFSFSRTKEDLYIFPIVPAVAALVGQRAGRHVHPARLRGC